MFWWISLVFSSISHRLLLVQLWFLLTFHWSQSSFDRFVSSFHWFVFVFCWCAFDFYWLFIDLHSLLMDLSLIIVGVPSVLNDLSLMFIVFWLFFLVSAIIFRWCLLARLEFLLTFHRFALPFDCWFCLFINFLLILVGAPLVLTDFSLFSIVGSWCRLRQPSPSDLRGHPSLHPEDVPSHRSFLSLGLFPT